MYYESCSFLPSSSFALVFFFITVYPFFSISKSSVIFYQFCVEKNQVHFIYYAHNMYGCINIWLHKYCSWHLSCCFLSSLVLFSGSDYMIHKWVIIPGKEARSQWQYVSVYFRSVRSMGVLPEILCPVLTSPSSRTKQDWTRTKGSQVTLTADLNSAVLAERGAVQWKERSRNCIRPPFCLPFPPDQTWFKDSLLLYRHSFNNPEFYRL